MNARHHEQGLSSSVRYLGVLSEVKTGTIRRPNELTAIVTLGTSSERSGFETKGGVNERTQSALQRVFEVSKRFRKADRFRYTPVTMNSPEIKHDDERATETEAFSLSSNDQLLLQQLNQIRYWSTKRRGASEEKDRHDLIDVGVELIRPSWKLTQGISLHDWQVQAINAWFANNERGVIKVVTGAGKTILALAITERLQREDPDLRVAIVVPTTVLLFQWRAVLLNHGNLPETAIGLLGAGHDDTFDRKRRILICVLNSAAKKLPSLVQKAGLSDNLLLIADECHRAGAAQMQRVFNTKRKYSLGLSATPERETDADEDLDTTYSDDAGELPFSETVIGRELGDVVFEMNYAEAIHLGVLPPFTIIHYGLSLQPDEREKYERLSREIKDLRSDLETPKRRGLALIRWCRSKAAAGNHKAARLISLTTERKRLLYRIRERAKAVTDILQRSFEENPNTRAILFHESIDEVMNLFLMLRNKRFAVVAEHSEFPDEMRAESLRLFREGKARVIVSARSLIEGFNIPSADLGIIVAASSSVRQRVQTLGRLLRKRTDDDGAEKWASLYVLYANQSVDDRIYEKANWNEFVGAERNQYFLWPDVNSSAPISQSGPPRMAPISDKNLDPSNLEPGQPYPGNLDEGTTYSLDTQGNISDETGKFISRSDEVRAILKNSLKKGGRFRVTPFNNFVIELNKSKDMWQGIYLGQLKEPLRVSETNQEELKTQYLPGERYPIQRVEGKTFSVLQRDKRLIASKASTGIRFVTEPHSAIKQEALKSIQSFLTQAYSKGHRMSKITVTREGHVVYVHNNEAYFVGYAPEGAEGFQFEANKEK